MSYLVLHMDKFKKEAVRGIQSHNNRERESRSNPDIDYERSGHNYDLHESAAENYAEAVRYSYFIIPLKLYRKEPPRFSLIFPKQRSALDMAK